jgi:hypothetical protein
VQRPSVARRHANSLTHPGGVRHRIFKDFAERDRTLETMLAFHARDSIPTADRALERNRE